MLISDANTIYRTLLLHVVGPAGKPFPVHDHTHRLSGLILPLNRSEAHSLYVALCDCNFKEMRRLGRLRLSQVEELIMLRADLHRALSGPGIMDNVKDITAKTKQ
jgi:hypothetical protein